MMTRGGRATLLILAAAGFLALPAGPLRAEESEPVVLELFTSQGCSSCPPADELLSRLGSSEELRGKIIPLAFHVDYWDRLGWTDPFSGKAWTARQHDYARAFRKQSVYTPQIVVNGRQECVGSDSARILAYIRSAQKSSPLATIRIEPKGYDPAQRRLKVNLSAGILREGGPKELRLMLAVYENGLSTKVPRGENGGRTLLNDYVVRLLETVLSLPGGAGQAGHKEITLTLPAGWNPEKSGIAAFLQDPESLEIYGSAAQAVLT